LLWVKSRRNARPALDAVLDKLSEGFVSDKLGFIHQDVSSESSTLKLICKTHLYTCWLIHQSRKVC
jgi:hypothetical protein